MGQQHIGEIAQHARRHQRVVMVLNLDVQDESLSLPVGDAGHKVGVAVFDPLLLGVQQLHFGDGQVE